MQEGELTESPLSLLRVKMLQTEYYSLGAPKTSPSA